MSDKAPKTTEFPNWDDLLDDYLQQQASLQDVIGGLRALNRDASELEHDLKRLQQRIEAVDQMRMVVAQHQAA